MPPARVFDVRACVVKGRVGVALYVPAHGKLVIELDNHEKLEIDVLAAQHMSSSLPGAHVFDDQNVRLIRKAKTRVGRLCGATTCLDGRWQCSVVSPEIAPTCGPRAEFLQDAVSAAYLLAWSSERKERDDDDDDDDVSFVSERTWEERDKECRLKAVRIE